LDTGKPVVADTLNPAGNAGIGGATYDVGGVDAADDAVELKATGALAGTAGP